MKFSKLSLNELKSMRDELQVKYDEYKAMNLALDMTRGKPSPAQLDLNNSMYTDLEKDGFINSKGQDVRNYGIPAGIDEARQLFAEILNTKKENVFIGNSSSLNHMFDTLTRAMIWGEHDSVAPWSTKITKKWLCVVPGYDRHFKVTESMGFELINVPITKDGPNMDLVEELVKDPDVLGMWCVPVYSNPDGITYSEEVCKRLAAMETAAPDFRIYWDNAYIVHHLYSEADKQASTPDILKLCEEAGHPSRVYEFASTSKVTFPGAGISVIACNEENMKHAMKIMSVQTICNNKVNQLAHVRMLPDLDAVKERMAKHAEILRPKFDLTISILDEQFGDDCDIVHYIKPNGGYFISFFAMPGTADKVVAMCKDAGVAFTPAGSTYPYGKDPNNSNIRLAPSFPSLEDIDKAVRVLALCAKITAIDKLLEGQV